MEYQKALAYMKTIEKYGSVPGLDSIKELLRRLGNPHKKFSIIQISGTNGKGSTGAFLTSILIEAGCKVGRFFSPAVFGQRETISFQGEMISEEQFGACLKEVAFEADAMEKEGMAHPTIFEVETALAYLYFQKRACEIAVVECGMGGTLDATNVTETNLLSIITSISMDHMGFLGNTLGEITSHKCGIIKYDRPVVTVRQHPEAEKVLEQIAKEKQANLYYVSDYVVENMELGLKGSFQKENAALAVMAVYLLQREGYSISRDAIKNGLRNTRWNGRFQQIFNDPDVWLDGAHNPEAALRLKEAFIEVYGDRKAHVIMGVFRDKEPRQLCEIMKPLIEHLYTITPPGPRGLSAQDLTEIAESQNILTTTCESVEDAFQKVLKQMNFTGSKSDTIGLKNDGDKGIVLVFGSLSYLQDAEKSFKSIICEW